MNTDKLEAALSLGMIMLFAYAVSTFSPMTRANAIESIDGMPIMNGQTHEDSRSSPLR